MELFFLGSLSGVSEAIRFLNPTTPGLLVVAPSTPPLSVPLPLPSPRPPFPASRRIGSANRFPNKLTTHPDRAHHSSRPGANLLPTPSPLPPPHPPLPSLFFVTPLDQYCWVARSHFGSSRASWSIPIFAWASARQRKGRGPRARVSDLFARLMPQDEPRPGRHRLCNMPRNEPRPWRRPWWRWLGGRQKQRR
jgi:hypothetical protein